MPAAEARIAQVRLVDGQRAAIERLGLAIAYTNRGFAYRGKGDYDRAIADHTKAIELDPKNLPILRPVLHPGRKAPGWG